MSNNDRQPLVENNVPPPQSYPPANYPPPGYAQANPYPGGSQYPPPNQYPPQNQYPPPGYAPPVYSGSPQAYPGSGYPPQGHSDHPGHGQGNPGPRYVVTPVQPVYGNAVVMAPTLLILGDMSTEVVCPHCRQTVLTNVQKRAGNTAWIICLILCVFCFPFCIYPLICDPCLDTYHICPACQQIISIKTP